MRKILTFLLATVMVFSLAACGVANSGGEEPSAPADGWAAEYTILIGGSDEWTPFAGKSGVTFANSDDKVIDVSDDGTTVEFAGKKVGESVITATLDGTESKAIVRVRAVQAGEDLLKWRLPKSLYLKAISNDLYLGEPREFYWTGGEFEFIYWEDPGDESVRIGIQYGSASLYQYYWYLFDSAEPEYIWADPGQGWGDDILNDDYLFSYGSVIPTLTGGLEKNHGGDVFRPLNDFAFAAKADHGFIADPDISKYRTGRHETVLGINCDVFEITEDIKPGNYVAVPKGTLYYVDPATHYTLKTVWADGTVDEVLEYDANYSGGVPYAPGGEVSIE
jgi:hypothetical protein